MAYKLEVNHPHFPKGFEFDCDGILVENGSTVTLTAEDELAFISRWGKDVKHFYGHGTHAKVTGSSELSAKQKADAMPEVSDTPESHVIDEDKDKDGGE